MYLPEAFSLSYLLCLLLIYAQASSSSFDFPDFSQVVESTNCGNSTYTICLQGDAAIVNNRTISLTEKAYGRLYEGKYRYGNGRASYSEPLLLYNRTTGKLTDFSTTFTLEIDCRGQQLQLFADGATFFLAPYPSEIPQESTGGGLALVSGSKWRNTYGRPPFVAVEFDSWCDSNYDPNVPHLGIDINNVSSVKYADITSYFLMGAGTIADVTVAYEGATHNLSVEFVYGHVSRALWYVVDLKEVLPQWVSFGFTAGTGGYDQITKIHSWRFLTSYDFQMLNNTYPHPDYPKNKDFRLGRGIGGILAVVGGCFLVLIIAAVGGFCHFRKKRNASINENDNDSIDEELEKEKGPRRFPYNELVRATNSFSEEKKLGAGGFGAVYHGFLADQGLDVAVKRFCKDSRQGKKEYLSEIKAISQLRHKNLVQLTGWCHQSQELLLIYEFMPNGSLDNHLFGMERLLPWPLRYKIALGLASALLYLHEEWKRCVVHRDIKSSNVMLDSEFNAKLGDFGLARITEHGSTLHTTFVAGTMGYLAPECLIMGKGSKESDVYSFGIVALEIACGRRTIEPGEENANMKLVNWVWALYGDNELLEAADKRLFGMFDTTQMEQLLLVGLWCAHPYLDHRPSMKQVIRAFNFELSVPQLSSTMPMPMYSYTPPTVAQDASTDVSSASTYPSGTSSSFKNEYRMYPGR